MDYLKKTLDYLFLYGKGKRFFLLWLFFLPTCLLVGLFFPTSKYVDILFSFRTATYPSFSAFWLNSFNSAWWALVGLAIAFVLFLLSVSYVSAIITRHIRIGKLAFPNFFRAVNNNFFPAMAVTAFFLLVAFVAHLVFIGLAYLWMQLASRVLGLVMTILFLILILIGMTYLLSSTTMWLPTMSFSGQYVFRALGVAFYKSRNYQRKFFVPALFAVAAVTVVAVAGHFCPVWYVTAILHALIYSVVLTVTVAFSFITYCESESIKREDLAQKYFGR